MAPSGARDASQGQRNAGDDPGHGREPRKLDCDGLSGSPAIAGALSLLPGAALAQAPHDAAGWPWPFNSPYVAALTRLEQHEAAALALILGVVCFAVVTSILLVRTRGRAAAAGAAAREKVAGLKSQVDQLTGLLLSEPHVLVSWPAAGDEPHIIGETLRMTGDAKPANVLAFGAWLDVDDARAMMRAVERLRAHGEGFSRTLTTTAGRQVEAEGRAIAGRAVMKLRDVSGIERKLSELKAAHEQLKGDADALRALIEALPAPAWVRDAGGHLAFANAAYARATGAADGASAAAQGAMLLDAAARGELDRAAAGGGRAALRLAAMLAGQRRSLDVIEVPTARGRAGIGLDASETETLRARARPARRRASPHARPDRDRRRHLRGRPEARVPQRRLPHPVGSRRHLPRPAADRLRGARPPARRPQAPRPARFPPVEGAAARGLRRERGAGACVASARRPHAAGRRDARIPTAA